MPLRTVPVYSRDMLRSHPRDLFVFGDNMVRRGLKGQAKECRGEPNAVGIPTKWVPRRDEGAYFTDADFPRVKQAMDKEFLRLAAHIRSGGTVVFPADGIGTGLAALPRRAPRIHSYIQRAIARLAEIARECETEAPEARPG